MKHPRNTLKRVVTRWQIVGLAINDVVGSGIYLLPAAAAALLGWASIWAVLVAGLAVALLVLCYAQAASYFDQPGGSYLYAREAFGSFIGFECGWMTWLTRIASAAALSNGLAQAVAHFWPFAGGRAGQLLIIVASLALLTWINVMGVKAAARTGVAFVLVKLLPLAMFILIGLFYVDWSAMQAIGLPPVHNLGEAALLLLFAYAGFENTPAAAGEYKNPQRDVPFALIAMIIVITVMYTLVQLVALGTLPGVAESASPLAEAAGAFAGNWAALILTVGAAVSIMGTNNNTMLFGPRYVYALSVDGYGPQALARIHPRFRTPAVAIISQGVIALALALSGTFVQLALLSIVARLTTYITTTAALLILQRRYAHKADALRLPGGPVIPVLALLLSLGLLASATVNNLLAALVALVVGAVIYGFRREQSKD